MEFAIKDYKASFGWFTRASLDNKFVMEKLA